MGSLEKIDTSQIKHRVYDSCRSMIMDGTWKPGDRLPSENKMADQLGVSRVSIRSALQSLQAQGLIEIRRGEGSFVRPFNLSEQLALIMPHVALENGDIMDVLEYRLITEPAIAALAVEKATARDLEDLEALYSQMEQSVDDIVEFARLDEAFHIRLAEIADNRIIEKIYRVLSEVMSTAWLQICGTLGVDDGLHYHRKLIDAIESRDKRLGRALMGEHVQKTRDLLAASPAPRWGEDFS